MPLTNKEVLKSITHDNDLIEVWSKSLEEYDYVGDEPELGIYTRYFDLREMPPRLKSGGILTSIENGSIKFKIGYPNTRYWTIQEEFAALFQKVPYHRNILRLAEKTIAEKIGNTE